MREAAGPQSRTPVAGTQETRPEFRRWGCRKLCSFLHSFSSGVSDLVATLGHPARSMVVSPTQKLSG